MVINGIVIPSSFNSGAKPLSLYLQILYVLTQSVKMYYLTILNYFIQEASHARL